MCAQVSVGHGYLLLTFGVFTEVSVGKFFRSFAVVRPETFVRVYTFSSSFCTAHWALDLARDRAP